MTHTPTPWNYHRFESGYQEIWGTPNGDGAIPVIVNNENRHTLKKESDEIDSANFELICKAVNSHKAMVGILELLVDLENDEDYGREIISLCDDALKEDIFSRARNALKLAKGDE